jgi:8-oxo-dGTP diphosphatase
MPYCYKYPRPAVTVDIILQSADNKVLLIKRRKPPFQSLWALPGGFLDFDETLDSAAHRELVEETGLDFKSLGQFKTYSALNRDPRHRTISTVFYGLCGLSASMRPSFGDDAADAQWFDLDNLPTLAFDHDLILSEFKNFVQINS